MISRAQPFAEMLFQRETEGQIFDTPEKRAALERRLRELTQAITDETLRKHYAADMAQRLGAMFGTAPAAGRAQGYGARERGAAVGASRRPFDPGPQDGRRRRAAAALAGRGARGPRGAARNRHPRGADRPSATAGKPVRGDRQPGVRLADARPVPRRLLDLEPEAYAAAEALAAALAERGHGAERERILAAASKMPDWWCLRPEAELSDAEVVLRQCLALQRKAGALHKELKSAEAALAADPTEQNFARLLDIKASLADLANAEAAVEGFGEAAGRKLPPV